eukprot:COSAG01_NODE_14267_length_1474_cov_557.658182_1_plen_239_part_00
MMLVAIELVTDSAEEAVAVPQNLAHTQATLGQRCLELCELGPTVLLAAALPLLVVAPLLPLLLLLLAMLACGCLRSPSPSALFCLLTATCPLLAHGLCGADSAKITSPSWSLQPSQPAAGCWLLAAAAAAAAAAAKRACLASAGRQPAAATQRHRCVCSDASSSLVAMHAPEATRGWPPVSERGQGGSSATGLVRCEGRSAAAAAITMAGWAVDGCCLAAHRSHTQKLAAGNLGQSGL